MSDLPQPALNSVAKGLTVVAIALAVLVSCQEQAVPTEPIPTPAAYDQLFHSYHESLLSNPEQVDEHIRDRKRLVVRGPITSIQGAKVQFHVRRQPYARDWYVECVFMDERQASLLSEGEMVTVLGRLDRADHVVRLIDCSLAG